MCEREARRGFEGSEEILGNFSKFCEPLEKVRARFSEKKIPPKKAHWSATRRRKFRRTLDVGVVHDHGLQLRAISQHLDIACVE